MTTKHKSLTKFNDTSYARFVTTNTYNKYPYFKDEEFCRILVEELDFYRRKYGFTLLDHVIMPDHLHLLVWWDKEEKPGLLISKIMQGIKGSTARRILNSIRSKGLEQMLQPTRRDTRTNSHKQNLKYRIWQPGFYDYNIYSEEKLLEKLNYIRNNPLRAGLVPSSEKYKWSSYNFGWG